MKITIETAKLMEIIDLGLRFVSKNATLPILQNFYFKASIDSLILRATDMEKYIEMEIPCTIIMEWAVTVNARMFTDIIKSIEEKEVEINVDQKTQIMTLKSAKDNFDINGIAASEYVALPEVPNENTFSIENQMFADGIAKVEYSVTEKNFSPVLTGVLLKAKEDSLIFVGTDSFRLAEYKAVGIKETDFALIVPKITMTDIQKIAEFAISNEEDTMSVHYSENLIAFQVQVKDIKILATSLLIQGNFPEYDREEIMPRNFNTKILVDKNLCEKAIRKIGILTRDINNYIQIETNNSDSIIISSGKTDKGAGTTTIPAIIEGEGVNFGINGKYITDFIKSIKGDELVFNAIDSQKPLILMDKEDNSYKYVVRPLINS